MDDQRDIVSADQVNQSPGGMHVLDYLAVLLKWRKFILTNILCVTVMAVAVSLLMPKWYKARASLLQPKEQGLLNPFGSASTLLKGLVPTQKLGGLGQNLGAYNYIAILKSRSAMEEVIRKFDLITVYDIGDSSMEKAIKELTENVAFEIQDEDYVTIDVFDRSPRRAADIANYFVEVLNTMSINLGTQEARSNREFIEKRVEKNKADLRGAEDSLRHFQERSGIMIAPDQNTSSISSIAELYGMKAKKEIEVAILERTVSKDNSALEQLKIELSELEKKLALVPAAGLESYRLYRNVAIQQKIVEFLVPIYEQAKLDEQKDVPVILVLDRAIPPEKKDRPNRLIIVLLWNLIGIALSLIWLFSWEAVNRLPGRQQAIPLLRELQGLRLYRRIFHGR